jgi:stage II sporulation protein GA (sporulation sigma-E factor processing peptidase)
MAIYAEYLFLENGIAGLLILLLTRKLCGFSSSRPRIALGSTLCGLYAFILFWEGLLWWLAILFKAAFSVGVMALVFPSLCWKNMARGVLVFYLISFAMGGIVIGSLYFFKTAGVAAGGAFYIGQITYIRVFSGMALAWVVLSVFAGFLKERVNKGRKEAQLRVTLGDNTVTMKGFIDTGNFLRDPISGRPVCVAAKQAMEGLIPEAAQFCFIPYRGVDKIEGFLTGIRPDSAVLLTKGGKPEAVNIILAVSKGELPVGQDGKRYDVLLHETLTEGGILQGE